MSVMGDERLACEAMGPPSVALDMRQLVEFRQAADVDMTRSMSGHARATTHLGLPLDALVTRQGRLVAPLPLPGRPVGVGVRGRATPARVCAVLAPEAIAAAAVWRAMRGGRGRGERGRGERGRGDGGGLGRVWCEAERGRDSVVLPLLLRPLRRMRPVHGRGSAPRLQMRQRRWKRLVCHAPGIIASRGGGRR